MTPINPGGAGGPFNRPNSMPGSSRKSYKSWLQNFNPDGTRRPGLAAAAEVASGKVPPPSTAAAAAGNSPLDVQQRAMAIGEPIPLVFCRRRYAPSAVPGAMAMGGVLLSPPATEARFENDATTITASYHCVLGEGRMGDVQVRDVRRGGCRVGNFSQNYSARAGTWAPGNFATAQTAYTVPEFPQFTGGGGSYEGLSTIEFRGTCAGGADTWRTQWHAFCREGLIIERGRLLDGVAGPSDNIADLVLYALQASSRVPDDLIDLASFTAAAVFTDTNNMWFNGEIKDAGNLEGYLTRILPFFLLRMTKVGGKYALRPLVETYGAGLMYNGPITPAMVLSEPHIIPDSFEITYSDAASRRPTALQIMWRQQELDDDIPLVRTLEVGLAGDAPFEQHDLSAFCTNELHAGRAGAYLHARRYLSSHTATVKLRPGDHSGTLAEGDVVRVELDLNASRDGRAQFAQTYQVESIGRAWTGEETLSLSMFPINSAGASLITAAVSAVSVPGQILPSNRTNSSCDVVGRAGDGSIPAKTTSGTPYSPTASRVVLPDRAGDQVQSIWPGTAPPPLPAGPTFLPVQTVTRSASYSPVVQVNNATASRSLSVSGLGGPVTKVVVTVNFTKCDDTISSSGVCQGIGEPFYDEMGLRLIAPDLSFVDLIIPSVTFTSGGTAAGNSFTFTFDDDAATPVAQAATFNGTGGIISLVSGTYRPQSALSAFIGIVGNGNWSLRIEDQGNRDPLSLNSWSINVQAEMVP